MGQQVIDIRELSDTESMRLAPGDPHYRAYVGPPDRYDLLGAAQFRLLATLGLRETHRVLDFGCGSLRAGRMLIAYLQAECYFGVEPNQWLIDDALKRQLGEDIVRIKKPSFSTNTDFSVPFRENPFDFVLAQSIFSHTGRDLAHRLLGEFAEVISPSGIVAATFSVREFDSASKELGWVYPGCVKYCQEDVLGLAREAGLAVTQIPFFHPTQRWFLMSKEAATLPLPEHLWMLTGGVFNVSEFTGSLENRGEVR